MPLQTGLTVKKPSTTTLNCKECKRPMKRLMRNGVLITKVCKDCRNTKLRLKKEKKKAKKQNSISYLIRQADVLFAQAIKLRDKVSRKSGSSENLQCSHIWGRANKSVRWDMDNAFTLTAGEHLYWWHKEPVEAVEWAKQVLGLKKWEELKQKRNAYFKLTPEFLKNKIQELKQIIEQYK